MARDKHERKHRKTWRHPEAVAFMASGDFDSAMSLSAAMGLRRCVHGETFPCEQCNANRRWNEVATGKKLTDAEFEREYCKPE